MQQCAVFKPVFDDRAKKYIEFCLRKWSCNRLWPVMRNKICLAGTLQHVVIGHSNGANVGNGDRARILCLQMKWLNCQDGS